MGTSANVEVNLNSLDRSDLELITPCRCRAGHIEGRLVSAARRSRLAAKPFRSSSPRSALNAHRLISNWARRPSHGAGWSNPNR